MPLLQGKWADTASDHLLMKPIEDTMAEHVPWLRICMSIAVTSFCTMATLAFLSHHVVMNDDVNIRLHVRPLQPSITNRLGFRATSQVQMMAAKKETGPLPKPKNAWMTFLGVKRQEAPNTKMSMKELADQWKSLSDEEKKPFQDMAAKAKREYEKQLNAAQPPPDPAPKKGSRSKKVEPAAPSEEQAQPTPAPEAEAIEKPKAKARGKAKAKAAEKLEEEVEADGKPKTKAVRKAKEELNADLKTESEAKPKSKVKAKAEAKSKAKASEGPPEEADGKPKRKATTKVKDVAAAGVKRPLTAYFLFLTELRKTRKVTASEAGKLWKDASPEVKAKYEALAKMDKENYELQMAAIQGDSATSTEPAKPTQPARPTKSIQTEKQSSDAVGTAESSKGVGGETENLVELKVSDKVEKDSAKVEEEEEDGDDDAGNDDDGDDGNTFDDVPLEQIYPGMNKNYPKEATYRYDALALPEKDILQLLNQQVWQWSSWSAAVLCVSLASVTVVIFTVLRYRNIALQPLLQI